MNFYPHKIEAPNAMQIRSAMKPYEKRRRKQAPLWVALLMFAVGVVGLIGLLIAIFE